MLKRRTVCLVVTAFVAMAAIIALAQNASVPRSQDNIAMGERQVRQMLLLMDQDRDGKVSKQEFMKFMAGEFDRLDKKNEGKLDVKELTKPPAPTVKSFHK